MCVCVCVCVCVCGCVCVCACLSAGEDDEDEGVGHLDAGVLAFIAVHMRRVYTEHLVGRDADLSGSLTPPARTPRSPPPVAGRTRNSQSWRSSPRTRSPAAAASPSCPTSWESGPQTGRTPREHCWASPQVHTPLLSVPGACTAPVGQLKPLPPHSTPMDCAHMLTWLSHPFASSFASESCQQRPCSTVRLMCLSAPQPPQPSQAC